MDPRNNGSMSTSVPQPPAAPALAAAASPKPAVSPSPKPATPSQPPPSPAPPPPNPLAHLPILFKGVDYAARGYHCEASVSSDQVVAVAELLDKEGLALDTITGVDWMAEGQMEVVYDYFHPAKALRAVVRTRIPRDNPELPTIHKVFPGANWHERETHDFFGIRFLGHPDLSPFLLPEDADFHPLRKDYAA